jgi:carboxyl-terminal processing protease
MSALFPGHRNITIVFSRDAEPARVARWKKLFEEQRAALERELELPFTFADDAPQSSAAWRIGLGGFEGPTLTLDRARAQLVSGGRTLDEIEETFSHLRSLHRFAGGTWVLGDCTSVDDAIERLTAEVATSYPAFAYRGISWEALCARYSPLVKESHDPIAAMQEWLAQLHDGHTWVRPIPPYGELPYRVWVAGDVAKLIDVPEESSAFAHGVRAGFSLVGEHVSGWWRRTAAPPHSRTLLTGRRILSAPVGTERSVAARAPDGRLVTWKGTFTGPACSCLRTVLCWPL